MPTGLRIVGPGIKGIRQQIIRKVNLIHAGLPVLAQLTVDQMRAQISFNRKRKHSVGNLEASITATPIQLTVTGSFIGIGDIAHMFSLAPYWYVVDWGMRWPGSIDATPTVPYIPPVNRGFFAGGKAPVGGHAGTELWIHTAKKDDFLLTPDRAIRPMNFTANTAAWLSLFWDSYWSNLVLDL